MKKSLSLLLILSCTLLFSQNIELTRSGVGKDYTANSTMVFALNDGNGGVFTIRLNEGYYAKKSDYLISHYDNQLKLINEIEYQEFGEEFIHAFIKDEQLYILEKERKGDDLKFNILSTSINSLNISKEHLFSMNEGTIKEYFPKYIKFDRKYTQIFATETDNGYRHIIHSNNDKYFSIIFSLKDKENQNYGIITFDDSFKKVYSKTLQESPNYHSFVFEDMVVDDNGKSYVVVQALRDKLDTFKRKTSYHTEVQAINNLGIKKTILTQKGHGLSTVKILVDKANLACVGLESKVGNMVYSGFFRADMDKESLAISNISFNPLPDQFIIDKIESLDKYKKPFTNNLSVRDCFLVENNAIIFNAEETSAGGAVAGANIPSGANNIVSFKISNNGKLLWARSIDKQQKQNYNQTHSYKSMYANGSVYFFINAKKNAKLTPNNNIKLKSQSAKSLDLYAVSLDEKGVLASNVLINNKDMEMPFLVKTGKFISGYNEIILFGSNKSSKSFELLKININ